jgi:hypothetical protein
MKKIYLLLSLAFFTSFSVTAQNPVPNGNFETWTNGTYDVPQFFPTMSNPSTFFKCNTAFNCVKTTDAYHGTYALQLTTLVGNDTCMGYVVNANPEGNGNPCAWPGGIPCSQAPAGIRGYYKCNVAVGDSAGLIVGFKQNGTCLGLYMYKFGGVQSSYAPFNITFSPPVMGTPDSMIFAAISSDIFNNVQMNGSTIKLDSISLTGVMSQPAQLNGDFENWQSVNVAKPTGWYTFSDDQGNGMAQSADSYTGVYAMETMTFLENNGIPQANSSGVSTGYWDNACSCRKGGYPFTNTIDTLAFYYKYVPTITDSVQVSVILKQMGSTINMSGKNFGQAVAYTYAEVPVSSGMTPDSVVVEFRTSTAMGNPPLSAIGSDLKIDDVHFKSQTTGLASHNASAGISIFPNPSANGAFTVKNVGAFDLVRVYNTLGQEVNAQISKEAGNAIVQINTPGAYYLYINASGKVTTQKIVVGGNK